MELFTSILFLSAEDRSAAETSEAPAFFIDLNLDQIVDAITARKQEYNLKPFFYTSLKDLDAIEYRHEVLHDLENKALFSKLQEFAQAMRRMREHLTQSGKVYYERQKERWFLDAVDIYCDTILQLSKDLSEIDINSRGFAAFRAYLKSYVQSSRFQRLLQETKTILSDLATIQYSLIIKGSSITVRKYEPGINYSTDVEETFAKFKQGAVKDYRVEIKDYQDMNHVEAKVLDFVAQLFHEVFDHLESYCAENRQYLDQVIGNFDRDIQFYMSYLEYIAWVNGEVWRSVTHKRPRNPSKYSSKTASTWPWPTSWSLKNCPLS